MFCTSFAIDCCSTVSKALDFLKLKLVLLSIFPNFRNLREQFRINKNSDHSEISRDSVKTTLISSWRTQRSLPKKKKHREKERNKKCTETRRSEFFLSPGTNNASIVEPPPAPPATPARNSGGNEHLLFPPRAPRMGALNPRSSVYITPT